MLLRLTHGERWQERLLNFVRDQGGSSDLRQVLRRLGGFSPDVESMSSFDRRPGAVALTTHGLAPRRVIRTDTYSPESVAEVEVYEDGGIRLFLSRLSEGRPQADDPGQLLFEAGLVTYARLLLALTVGAAEESGYFGNWSLGVAATGLRGCRSSMLARNWMAIGVPVYSGDAYERATVATYAELTTRPGSLAERLVGQLLRSVGTHEALEAALSDSPQA